MIAFHTVRDIRFKTASKMSGSAWLEITVDMEDSVDVCFYVPAEHDHIAHQKMAAITKLLRDWPPTPLVEEATAPTPPLPE